MNLYLLNSSMACILAAGALVAQSAGSLPTDGPRIAPIVSTEHSGEHSHSGGLQVPILGYLAPESSLVVRPIYGAPGAVVAGREIALPREVTVFYLAPGQSFGLVAQLQGSALGILELEGASSGPVQTIPNSLSTPDRVAFSPSGLVAVLYSATRRQAQVVAGLPLSGHVAQTLDLTPLGSLPLTSLAVSDDAEIVLAGVSDGTSGTVWALGDQKAQRLLSVGVPSALRFLAGKQNALVADSVQQQVSLVTGVAPPANVQLLAGSGQGLRGPTDVDISGDQQEVWVTDPQAGLIAINLSSGSVSATTCLFPPSSLIRIADDPVYVVSSQDGGHFGVWAPKTANSGVWWLASSWLE